MTSPTQLPHQGDPNQYFRLTLPTMYDLPSEDPEEPGLPDTFHLDQSQLLDITFGPPNWDRDRVFAAIDLNLYYDLNNTGWYKRPDWFAVVGVPKLYEGRDMRLSYVIWQELVSPIVVVELLSPGTEAEDLGETVTEPGKPPIKWEVYEQILQVPYYIVFSRYTNQIQVFRLVDGRYQRAQLTEGLLLIPELELSLGLWRGAYKGIDRLWLRWFTASFELVPTPQEQTIAAQEQTIAAQEQAIAAQEQAIAAQERAKAAEQQATAARLRSELLAARLRELGIDPDELA